MMMNIRPVVRLGQVSDIPHMWQTENSQRRMIATAMIIMRT